MFMQASTEHESIALRYLHCWKINICILCIKCRRQRIIISEHDGEIVLHVRYIDDANILTRIICDEVSDMFD